MAVDQTTRNPKQKVKPMPTPLQSLPGPSPTPSPEPVGAIVAAPGRLAAWIDDIKQQDLETPMTFGDATVLLEGIAEVLKSEE